MIRNGGRSAASRAAGSAAFTAAWYRPRWSSAVCSAIAGRSTAICGRVEGTVPYLILQHAEERRHPGGLAARAGQAMPTSSPAHGRRRTRRWPRRSALRATTTNSFSVTARIISATAARCLPMRCGGCGGSRWSSHNKKCLSFPASDAHRRGAREGNPARAAAERRRVRSARGRASKRGPSAR